MVVVFSSIRSVSNASRSPWCLFTWSLHCTATATELLLHHLFLLSGENSWKKSKACAECQAYRGCKLHFQYKSSQIKLFTCNEKTQTNNFHFSNSRVVQMECEQYIQDIVVALKVDFSDVFQNWNWVTRSLYEFRHACCNPHQTLQMWRQSMIDYAQWKNNTNHI